MAFTARIETYVNVSSLSDPYDITVTKPTGTVDGDILFCLIAWYHPSATIDSVPSGWSLLGEYLANNDRYAVYYKVAASEPASWDWSFTSSMKVRAVCSCYTGGDFNAADPIDVISNTAYRVTDTSCIAASMIVSAVNSPLVFWAGVYHTSEQTFTKPSVPTEDWVEDDDAGSTDPDFWTEVCSMIWSGSGASGDMTATISLADAQKHAFAVALNPPGGAIQKAIDGTLSFAGSAIKSVTKNISGALTLSAILAKYTGKLPVGSLTFQGSVQKTISKAIAGSLAFAGSLIKMTPKALSGAITFAGSVIKATSKIIGGAVSFIGTLVANLISVGRRLKMWLFQRPYLNMVVETKTYRDVSTETREVKP